jgi:hypothetical protein
VPRVLCSGRAAILGDTMPVFSARWGMIAATMVALGPQWLATCTDRP